MIGAPTFDYDGFVTFAQFGAAYVIFGAAEPFPKSLSVESLDGSNGFRVRGSNIRDFLGSSVAGGGDINGDGLDDVVIGAYGTDRFGAYSGSVYVVFGKRSAFLDRVVADTIPGTGGVRIDGASALVSAGKNVAIVGDTNGDGLDDILFHAAANGRSPGPASAQLFLGSTSLPTTISLPKPDGLSVLRFDGEGFDGTGRSVAGAGDVNGDGYADLMIGSPWAENGLIQQAGAAYIFYGQDFGGRVMFEGDKGSNRIIGGGGDDSVIGGLGNDVLAGGQGSDVLYGGHGNDVINYDESDRSIVGGSGIDALKLIGLNSHIDLSTGTRTRIQQIDVIDMSGAGKNELKLSLAAVLDITDTGTLRVLGDSVDSVTMVSSGWIRNPNEVIGTQEFKVYLHGGAELYVLDNVAVSIT